jgi:hypothetical protein
MHCIWTLPEGDDDFSSRWKMIKTAFSKGLPKVERRSKVRIKRGERGIWQRRFWEHAIRNERDYEAHMDYLHFNPVKHGWVKSVIDWPYSSFHPIFKTDFILLTGLEETMKIWKWAKDNPGGTGYRFHRTTKRRNVADGACSVNLQ